MMHVKKLLPLLTSLGALGLSPSVLADVRPHALFTDHAVLQRNRPLPVWGTAADGEKVTVRLGGHLVLDRANAALPPRARVGLVGRNGMRVLGVLRPVRLCVALSRAATPFDMRSHS